MSNTEFVVIADLLKFPFFVSLHIILESFLLKRFEFSVFKELSKLIHLWLGNYKIGVDSRCRQKCSQQSVPGILGELQGLELGKLKLLVLKRFHLSQEVMRFGCSITY